MPADERKLPATVDPRKPGDVEQALRQIGINVEPTPKVIYAVSAEGAFAANTRRFTITVTDQLGQAWTGRWWVIVYVSATAAGDPSATGNTVTFTAGTILATFTANAAYLVLTDANGVVELNVAIAGAGTRHVAAEVLGKPIRSGAFAWL